MVSTSDSDSGNLGSIPGTTFFYSEFSEFNPVVGSRRQIQFLAIYQHKMYLTIKVNDTSH
jgi:hypothetical protein